MECDCCVLCEYSSLSTLVFNGGVAQMVERLLRMQEAQGSIPCSSTFAHYPVTFDGGVAQNVERLLRKEAQASSIPCSFTLHIGPGIDTLRLHFAHRPVTLTTALSRANQLESQRSVECNCNEHLHCKTLSNIGCSIMCMGAFGCCWCHAGV